MITLQCGDFFPLCPHSLETLPKVRTAEKDKKKYQRKKVSTFLDTTSIDGI
jgi:hypothetical protein